jgi:hypothetical protein
LLEEDARSGLERTAERLDLSAESTKSIRRDLTLSQRCGHLWILAGQRSQLAHSRENGPAERATQRAAQPGTATGLEQPKTTPQPILAATSAGALARRSGYIVCRYLAMSPSYERAPALSYLKQSFLVYARRLEEVRMTAQNQTPLIRDNLSDVRNRDQQPSPAEQARAYLERLRISRAAKADPSDVPDPTTGTLDAKALTAAKPVLASKAGLAMLKTLSCHDLASVACRSSLSRT